jgi:hypothetical protein
MSNYITIRTGLNWGQYSIDAVQGTTIFGRPYAVNAGTDSRPALLGGQYRIIDKGEDNDAISGASAVDA